MDGIEVIEQHADAARAQRQADRGAQQARAHDDHGTVQADRTVPVFAARDTMPVGAALTLPDINQVMAKLNGRLLPFGWAKALWYRRKINAVRVFALGVAS